MGWVVTRSWTLSSGGFTGFVRRKCGVGLAAPRSSEGLACSVLCAGCAEQGCRPPIDGSMSCLLMPRESYGF